jgi:hypothetical protein
LNPPEAKTQLNPPEAKTQLNPPEAKTQLNPPEAKTQLKVQRLRQSWFEGLAAGILRHVASLIGDARTNFNAICAAHTGSIVMMAFFDLAVDTPGHSAHPLSLIVAQRSWIIGTGFPSYVNQPFKVYPP